MRVSSQVRREWPSGRLFNRQRWMIGFLDMLGGRVNKLDFQKLLFLICQEMTQAHERVPEVAPYEFVPYKYGAFSFTSYHDLRRLADRGYLDSRDNTWILTDLGKQIAVAHSDDRIRRFANRHKGLRGEALIARTYRQHPYYAIRSTIAERILSGDQVTLGRIESARPSENRVALFTIGYEGRSIERYLNLLIGECVVVLCDIRKNAMSRKYGFSKKTLDNACKGVGIRYVHRQQLGIASRKRKNLRTAKDRFTLFLDYQCNVLPRQRAILLEIIRWLRAGESVVLTCYERDAIMCHRNSVTCALQEMFISESNSSIHPRYSLEVKHL